MNLIERAHRANDIMRDVAKHAFELRAHEKDDKSTPEKLTALREALDGALAEMVLFSDYLREVPLP